MITRTIRKVHSKVAHDIWNNNMAYLQSDGKPWHGLGKALTGNESIDECLQIAGMTHKIERRLVRMRINRDSIEDTVIPGYIAIVRDSDNHVFQIASDGYHPMQYTEMVSMFREFVEAGDMRMSTLGLLKDGAIAWCMASINQGFKLCDGDEINGNLLISTSHDGSVMNDVRFCHERVVCANTLAMAKGECGLSFQFKHSRKDKKAAIREAKERLKLAKDRFSKFADWCGVLASKPVQDEQQVYQYLIQLTGSQLLEQAIATTPANGNDLLESLIASDVETIKANKKLTDENLSRAGRAILDEIIESPGANLPSAKGTWWGVLNGVTHYFDHDSPTRIANSDNRAYARQDNRLTSAWYGVNAKKKEQAFDLAMQYATGKVN